MDGPDDKTLNAVELREEVEALRLRVAELEASREAAERNDSLRLRQASALARLGTWEWEPSTDRVTWSGDMFRIYGIQPEEFTGKGSDYFQSTRVDYRAIQQLNMEAAWKSGVTEDAFRAGKGAIGEFKELCIVRPDGTECYTMGDAVCVVDADGKPLRMLGITVDITERKKVEMALRQREEQLHLASRAAGFGTYSYESDTGVGHWSRELREHWGIGPDDPVQLDSDGLVPFLHPEDRSGFLAAMTSARDPRGDGIFEFEYRVIWPDGSVHWLRVRGRTEFIGEGENRRPWRSNGATVDITDRKRAAQALREAVVLHTSIVNSTPDLIWSVDPETFLLLTFNRSVETYFLRTGVSLKRGLALEQVLPTQDLAERWREFYQRALREGAYSIEYETFAENRVLYLSFNVLERDGVVFGVSVFGREITERKRTEETLRASEERYHGLFRDAAIGIFHSTFEGRFLDVNPALAKLLGYASPEEVVMSITSIADQVYADPVQRDAVRASALEAGGLVTTENRYRRKDGTLWDGRMHVRIVEDLQGKPSHFEGFVEDITEHKKAEALLAESQKKVHEAQALTHIGVWDWNAETDTVVWTEELYRIAGLDPKSAAPTFQEHSTLYAAESWQRLRNGVEKAMETGESYECELELIRSDGSTRFVNAFGGAKYDTHGQVSGIFGTVQDITERKRSEMAIVESEQKFAKAFRSSPGAVSLTALDDGRYLDVNEEFLRTTGFARDEVIGRTTADLNVWPTQEARQHFIEALAATGRLMALECAFRMRSGEIRQCQISSEVMDLNGTKCCLNFMLDITERKRAEAENAKLEAQLQQAHKMESVGRLAGGVAHDFNNMLGVILGHTELAMEQVAPSEPLRGDLEQIMSAAERSANLTRQLLAFARKQTIAPKVLDLNATVESMLKMLRQLIGEDIALVWLPGAGLSPVKVDPSQVDQILANLCVNARDAIGGVGKLTIETANCTFDDDNCATHAEVVPGEYVKLAVTDDGCGMDKASQERLFEPFFTTKELGKGTGLGLATVYGIVKQNNGFIKVTSEPGKGTTFEIYLRRYVAAKVGPAQSESPTEPVARGHETILVVEDEPAILDMTKKMLERLGYTVLTASTPGEAIRLASAYAGVIHLLMTDVVMPEMNGRDLAKHLLTSFPSLKRLFMSGYTADIIAHQGVLDEGVHFIQKPFSKKDLAVGVSEALARG